MREDLLRDYQKFFRSGMTIQRWGCVDCGRAYRTDLHGRKNPDHVFKHRRDFTEDDARHLKAGMRLS